MAERGRERLINIALVVVSVLVAFVAGEMIVRHTALGDRLGWNRIPPFEDRLAAWTPDGSRPNILAIGDSFTEFREGDGGNYVRFMEGRAKTEGKPLNVLNLSKAGTGLPEYRSVFHYFKDFSSPDIVLIGLFLGNDITPYSCNFDATQPHEAWKPGQDLPIGQTPPVGLRSVVKQHSVFLNFLYKIAKQHLNSLQSGHFQTVVTYLGSQNGLSADEITNRVAEADPDLLALAKSDAINPWDMALAVVNPEHYRHYILSQNDTSDHQALTAFTNCFGVFLDEIAATGAKPVVVLIPSAVQVGERHHTYFKDLGFDVDGTLVGNDTPLMNALNTFFSGRGDIVFNLLPKLQAADGPLYIPNDTHLNTRGQEIAGNALYQFMTSRGLIE